MSLRGGSGNLVASNIAPSVSPVVVMVGGVCGVGAGRGVVGERGIGASVPYGPPPSHGTMVVVIVVMVPVFGVCDLQAGFPLRRVAIRRVCRFATWRTFLKEVGHKVHLERRGGEGRGEEETGKRILA